MLVIVFALPPIVKSKSMSPLSLALFTSKGIENLGSLGSATIMLSCSLRNFGRQNGNLSDIPSAENLISLGPTSKGITLSVGTSTGTSSPVAVSGTDISEAPTPTTPITSDTSKLPTASIVVASDIPTESSVTLPLTSVDFPVDLILS